MICCLARPGSARHFPECGFSARILFQHGSEHDQKTCQATKRKRNQGINLALLAYTPNQGGRQNEANEMFSRAAVLLGDKDVDKLKELAAELIKSEELGRSN
jgi:histidyl-tRNA synthetase